MCHGYLIRIVLVAAAPLLGVMGPRAPAASAAPFEKPVFFATRAACAASRIFRKLECDNAFDNAFAEIKARHLSFTSRMDCVARFRLCERAGGGGAPQGAFAPVMLGVEIAKRPGGGVAMPVLAVEATPGLFSPRPIASVHAPAARADQSAGRVEPPDARRVQEDGASDHASGPAGPAAAADKTVWMRRETPGEWRERLKNAPFIP